MVVNFYIFKWFTKNGLKTIASNCAVTINYPQSFKAFSFEFEVLNINFLELNN